MAAGGGIEVNGGYNGAPTETVSQRGNVSRATRSSPPRRDHRVRRRRTVTAATLTSRNDQFINNSVGNHGAGLAWGGGLSLEGCDSGPTTLKDRLDERGCGG